MNELHVLIRQQINHTNILGTLQTTDYLLLATDFLLLYIDYCILATNSGMK